LLNYPALHTVTLVIINVQSCCFEHKYQLMQCVQTTIHTVSKNTLGLNSALKFASSGHIYGLGYVIALPLPSTKL